MSSFVPFPKSEIEQSIPDRFEEQVLKHGQRLAVKDGDMEYTYESLNQQANRIASALLAADLSNEAPIITLINQGGSFSAATLGVLKAGSFYTPLDPLSSSNRLTEVILGLGAQAIVTDASNSDRCTELCSPSTKIINLDSLDPGLSLKNPELEMDPDSLAYVYFTTGSTGKSKGVMDSHRNVLHNIMRYTNSLKICSEDRLTLLHSPDLSACVSSQLGALLNGASVFPKRFQPAEIETLPDWLIKEQITIYHSVPAVFRFALNRSTIHSKLRMIRLEGEEASIEDLKLFKKHSPSDCTLINGLGTSETGICSQYFFQRKDDLPPKRVPIGYPTKDMEIFILNEDGHPALPNQEGEIIVRSNYLSQGYWKQPETISSKFSQDLGNKSLLIWRSGDLGSINEDGCIEYLGRIDSVPDNQGRIMLDELTNTERILASIWSDLLERKDIERQSDFLLMNGNSLTAMRMTNRIKTAFSIQVSMRDVLENRLLEDLAELLESRLDELNK